MRHTGLSNVPVLCNGRDNDDGELCDIDHGDTNYEDKSGQHSS